MYIAVCSLQTDVTGNCPTEYEALGRSWSTRKVKKTKDMLGCMDRNGPHNAFQGTPFQVASVSEQRKQVIIPNVLNKHKW